MAIYCRILKLVDSAVKRCARLATKVVVAAVMLAALAHDQAWAANGVDARKSAENSPHVNFMLHCQGCHLPGGVGHPGIVPKLAGNVGKFLSVTGGREYLVQVPGSAQSSLDNAQLAEVLNWLVTEFDPEHTPQNFQRYSAQEVQEYRSARIRNVTQIRTELLNAYSK